MTKKNMCSSFNSKTALGSYTIWRLVVSLVCRFGAPLELEARRETVDLRLRASRDVPARRALGMNSSSSWLSSSSSSTSMMSSDSVLSPGEGSEVPGQSRSGEWGTDACDPSRTTPRFAEADRGALRRRDGGRRGDGVFD